jgi:D-lactate dehydrogenase (cytochrome)
VVLLERLNRVRDIDLAANTMTVEAGLPLAQAQQVAASAGRLFPLSLASEGSAQIGGVLATNAGGTAVLAYGSARELALGLEVVLAGGQVWDGLKSLRKDNSGYDLKDLFIGSEGTLGIITELTVRLYGIPDRIMAAVCPFRTLEGACNAVIQSIQLGVGAARMEIVDGVTIHAVNRHNKLALEEKPTLFLEFHGTEVSARDQVETFRQIAEAEGAIRFDWAEREEDRRRLWKARHEFYWAVKTTWPGREALATDVCVPISRLAECLLETEADIRSLGLIAPIAGHAGDGNFHTQPMFHRSNPKEMAAVETFLHRLAERAIAMEGTCTGEHGVGQGKAKYLKAELGEGVAVMRAIKSALDPDDILNPGKIFPA